MTQLQLLGFGWDGAGMVSGLALISDFQAALAYERIPQSLPAKKGRNSEGGLKNMPLVITSKPQPFELPTEGEHLAVLADVVDRGEVETDYGLKDRIQFIWLLEQRGTDGNLLSVRQKPHNKTMHEKSHLRKDIKRITGRDPGNSFDVESILGSNALVEIEHNTREGTTYANIVAIRRPSSGDHALQIPDNYKRSETPKRSKQTTKGGSSSVPKNETPDGW